MAVAGFDDIPMARYLTPPLTTVHVDMFRLGERAVELLLEPPTARGPPRRPARGAADDAGGARLVRRARRRRAGRRARAPAVAAALSRSPLHADARRRDGRRRRAAVSARRWRWRSRLRRRAPAPRAATATTATPRADRVPRHARAAHVPLVLGPDRPAHRPHARPLADAARSCSVAAIGLRAHRVSDRRRARLGDARRRPRERALAHAALLLDGAAGHGAARAPPATAASSITSSIPTTGHALRGRRAVDHRHRAAPGRRALLPVVLRPRRRRRRPRSARSPSRSTRASTGTGRRCGRRRSRIGWEPEDGLPALRLARLQRGDAAPHPGARLADASGRARRRGRRGRSGYRWGDVPRPGAPRLRAAVRPPVLARLDRFPRHPGRLHARARASTTSRTRAARRSRSAPTRSRTPAASRGYGARLWGLTACDGPVDGDARRSTAATREFHTYSARGASFTEVQRRRHDRADRGRRARSPFAPEVVMPDADGDARATTASTLFDRYGFLDAFNPTLRRRRCTVQHGRVDPGARLVRHRLPRHRPGADPGDDRELPQRAGVAHDAAQPARRARPARAPGFTGGWLDSAPAGAVMRAARAVAVRRAGAASSLGGCSPARARDDGVTLRFWAMGREGEVVQELVRDFEREQPGHPRRRAADPVDGGAREAADRATSARSTPDVAQLGNTWIAGVRGAARARAARRPWLARSTALDAERRSSPASGTRTSSTARRTACRGTSTRGCSSTAGPAGARRLRLDARRPGPSGARRWRR